MPVSGTPGGAGGATKLPQLKKDFNLAAAKPAPKVPGPPALKLNPPQRVAVAAPGLGKGIPMVPRPAAKAAARIAAPPKAAVAFKRAAAPGLKPTFQRAATAKPPQAPAIRAKQDFAKAAASPNRPKAPQVQKTQTRTKTK
jgi:hypothetical protein